MDVTHFVESVRVTLTTTPFYLDKHKPRAVSQIEKYYPQTSRLVLKKVELMMKHQPYQIRNPRFEDDGEGVESNRAEKEEERETDPEKNGNRDISRTIRGRSLARGPPPHTRFIRYSPPFSVGLGGVVRSASSCRRVVIVAAIRRSQPASLADLLTSNPTETTEKCFS